MADYPGKRWPRHAGQQQTQTRIPMMATIVPEGKIGRAEIQHRTITPEFSAKSYKAGGTYSVDVGTYAMLRIDGDIVMSDTKMERESNQDVIDRAHGKVLIAGLGIGMVPQAIMQKPEVELVHVIEKSQDVVDLVAPHIDKDKLVVITGDIFDVRDKIKRLNVDLPDYDIIYFDIWPTIGQDSMDDIMILHHRFRDLLNQDNNNRWIGSWMEERIVTELEEDRRIALSLRSLLDDVDSDMFEILNK